MNKHNGFIILIAILVVICIAIVISIGPDIESQLKNIEKDAESHGKISNVLIGYSSNGPYLNLDTRNLPASLSVGTKYWLEWDSQNVSSVGIVLERDGEYVVNLIWNLENHGSITWTPDNSIQSGDGYQIVVTEAGGNGYSTVFGKSAFFSIE